MNSTKLLLEFKSEFKTVKGFVKHEKNLIKESLMNDDSLGERDRFILLGAQDMLNKITNWDDVVEYIIQFII